MEFRTEAPGSNKDDSGGIDGFLNDYIQSIKSSEAAQQQLVSMMNQNDVPPALVAPLIDQNPDELQAFAQMQQQQQAQQQAQQQQTQQMDTKPEPKTETVKPEADDIIGFVDDIIDVKGEDVTLGELKEFAEKNPDTVDRLVDIRF